MGGGLHGLVRVWVKQMGDGWTVVNQGKQIVGYVEVHNIAVEPWVLTQFGSSKSWRLSSDSEEVQ